MIIRKYLIALACLTALACSKNDKATISVRIENYPAGEMSYLEELRVSGNRLIDSSAIRNSGKFRYSIPLKNPGFYQLTLSTGESLTLIISPEEKIRITANGEDFHRTRIISGSPPTAKLAVLHDSLRSAMVRLDNTRETFEKLSDSSSVQNIAQEELYRKFQQIREAHHSYSVRFILEDLKSLANIAALYQEYGPGDYVFNKTKDLQYYKLVSDTLTKYFPDVRYVKALAETTSQLISQYNTLRILKTKQPVSYDIPDLNLPSTDGKNYRLHSIGAKYVLLTFWSVDQQQSIQNTLALKKVYSSFKKKDFEIYQVCVDPSYEKFERQVAFEELKWVCVVDTSFPESPTRSLYNVNNLPMNYLLDMEKKEILAKNLSPDILEQSIQYLLTQMN